MYTIFLGFQGYPVYGIYAFSSANNSGSGITRMISSYTLRTSLNTTGRVTLYDGGATLTGS